MDFHVHEIVNVGVKSRMNAPQNKSGMIMPKFMNGDVFSFRAWVYGQVKYPEMDQSNNNQGIVRAFFTIDRNGVCAEPDYD